MCYSRPAVFDLLLVLGQLLVEDMALALDGEAEGLDEGREEADSDAYGDGDLCVAVEVGGHEARSEHGTHLARTSLNHVRSSLALSELTRDDWEPTATAAPCNPYASRVSQQ